MNSKYDIILFRSNEDESFIAEVPELSGCMADGKSYEDAFDNVQVVIGEWVETAKSPGREIPEPKGKLMYA
jgi:predicted RNase H-like HicB family nuclease